MAKGINIDFVSDVSKFIRGTDDIEKSLDKVSDSLDDLAKDADKAGEKAGDGIKDGIEDGADKAADAGKKLEKRFRDSFDAVKDDSSKAGDDVGDNVKRGFKKAEDAADEFKDEASSTSREAAASFTGDFEDVADAIQETLANALAGFGPAGAVAGMAAAAGIGILVSALQSSADKAAETKEKVIDLAGAIREAGGSLEGIDWSGAFEEFANAIADPKSWFEPWQAASKTNVEIIRADADKLGLSFSDLFQGLAGDSQAGQRALTEVNTKLAEQQQAYADLVARGVNPTQAANMTLVRELETQKTRLEAAGAATEDAVTIAELYQQALEGSTAAAVDYNEVQKEKLGLLREEAELNMSAAEAAAAWAEQQAENRDNLTKILELTDQTSDATRQATDAITENGDALDLNTQAGRLASQTLIDTAKAGMTNVEAMREQGASSDELRDKTQAARDEFIRTAKQMGLNQAAAGKLADEYGLIPDEVATTAKFEAGGAKAEIDAFNSKLASIPSYKQVTVDANAYFSSTGAGGADAWKLLRGYNSGGQVPGAASGVYVQGPGSDIDDRVPYRLSPGEFVMDAQATQQIGVGNLQALNEGIPPVGAQQAAAPPVVNVKVYLGDEEITDRMRVVAQGVFNKGMDDYQRAQRVARRSGVLY